MQNKLLLLAERAEAVAKLAADLAEHAIDDHAELHRAMVDYRAAAVAYIAHPSVSDYVRADALRYSGETSDAIDRIADLIDQLNRD
ncbi:MAG: hypothetical protein ABGW87_12180 [Sphingomonadaceae bacterium]